MTLEVHTMSRKFVQSGRVHTGVARRRETVTSELIKCDEQNVALHVYLSSR